LSSRRCRVPRDVAEPPIRVVTLSTTKVGVVRACF